MAKGGSTSNQIAQLMHLLGAISFTVAIFYGLYVATRDPEEMGAAAYNHGVVRVLILFLAGISFFLVALNYLHAGKCGKSKGGSCNPHGSGQSHGSGGRSSGGSGGRPSHGEPGYRGGASASAGGYNFGNPQNVYNGDASSSQE